MPRTGSHRGRRVRLATGIYRDRFGISAIVSVDGHPHEELRFDLGTELSIIEAARLRRRADLLEQPPSDGTVVRHGTLAADVPRFLELLSAGPRRDGFAT